MREVMRTKISSLWKLEKMQLKRTEEVPWYTPA